MPRQWNAATAGTGGTITSSNALGSVCPKGWKLPSSATSDATIAKGTFAYLLQQYGLASAYNTGTLTGTSSVNGNTYNIALSPLFFVRGGGIYPNYTNKFDSAGQGGIYWSSRAYSTTNAAYGLYFNNSYVAPSSNRSRYVGYSLRCLISTP